jgi:hypothetical protein
MENQHFQVAKKFLIAIFLSLRLLCHCEPAGGGRGNLPFVIARLPKGKPWQSHKEKISF